MERSIEKATQYTGNNNVLHMVLSSIVMNIEWRQMAGKEQEKSASL